jgi:competence protein ComEC
LQGSEENFMVTAAIAAPQQGVASTDAHRILQRPWIVPAPGMVAAVCFSAGILLARLHTYLPGLLLLAVVACCAVTTLAAMHGPQLGWFLVAPLFVALGIFSSEVAPAIHPQTRLAMVANEPAQVLTGEVVRAGPVRTVASTSPFSAQVREEHSQQLDVKLDSMPDSVVRLSIYAPAGARFRRIVCGQVIRASMALHNEERFLDPGVWDAGEYLHRQGIGALGSAHADTLTVLEQRRANLRCRLHSLQWMASARLLALPELPRIERLPAFFRIDRGDAGMLAAMVTGDRSYLQHRVRISFELTGSFHLLVVSGFHLAIFAGIIFWLSGRLRMTRLWATLTTIVLSVAYALFTGFGQPVERAFCMVTLYLLGRLIWRDRAALNIIGIVALVMLAADPASLFDSGLQMTLLSVLAVAGIAAPVSEKGFGPYLRAAKNLREIRIDPALPPRVAQFRVSLRMVAQHLKPSLGDFAAWRLLPFTIRALLRATELLVVSVAIEVFMSLPMAVYFHRVTLVALPVNLLVVPFLGVLLPCALATFAMVLAFPAAAAIPAAATAAVLHSVVWIVHVFARTRAGDLRLPMPSTACLLLWLLLIIIAICVVRLRRCGVRLAAATLLAAMLALVLPRTMSHRPGTLEIIAIDVGQGDSLLLITPQGKTLLVDAGGLVGASPDSNFNVGEDVVSPVLWSLGIWHLDAVALTHAHMDHIGGMPAVFANFHPRELWVGPEPDAAVYKNLLAQASALGTVVKKQTAGESFSFGGADFRVLAPASGYHPGSTPVNNDSLVLHVSYGSTSALLEGDAEAPSEARMVSSGGLHADLLKVGHHGSRTSTTPAFLAAVHPSFSVISVGRRNFYGHPRHETLEKLQGAHVTTYRTDMLGMTTFDLDGSRVTAHTWAASQLNLQAEPF